MVGQLRIKIPKEDEMKFVKNYLKLFIGIAVLILFVVVLFFAFQAKDLENGNMSDWIAASIERRTAAVKILTGTEEHTELMVQCLDKVANLPDATEMDIRDATALCFIGIQLKENI